jgi:hypothetical protein
MEGNVVTLFKDKIEWIKCAIRGALNLSNEALIEGEFKKEMSDRLQVVYDKIKSFDGITDAEQINKIFPVLEDEQTTVESIRAVFYNVIKTHKPDKFQARLTESRDYSHSLKVHFCVADCVSNKLSENLSSFFQQQILDRLNNQFDFLCDEMITAIENETIDIQGATQRIKDVAVNASEESIKNILNDIAKATDKKKHVVFKTLMDKKSALAKKKDEPSLTMKKF